MFLSQTNSSLNILQLLWRICQRPLVVAAGQVVCLVLGGCYPDTDGHSRYWQGNSRVIVDNSMLPHKDDFTVGGPQTYRALRYLAFCI